MPDDTVGSLSLRVTILGSSGTYAGPRQACSGYLLRSARTTVLLDAGPGTLANLQEHVALDETGRRRREPCAPRPLAGGAGHAQRVAVRDRGRGDRPVLHVRDARHGRTDLPEPAQAHLSATADHRPVGVQHRRPVVPMLTDRPPARDTRHARRLLESGRSATPPTPGPGWSIDELGPRPRPRHHRGDLPGSRRAAEGVHLSAHQAGTAAREAGVKRLVITHVQPTGSPSASEAEATDAYGAAVEAARPHQTYVV